MGCASSAPAAASAADVRLERAADAPVLTPLFFPDAHLPCRNYLNGVPCKKRTCAYAHEPTSLTKLLTVLRSASRTLEVCVFCITCNEIADVLETAAKRGVMVRIISDDEMAKTSGSDVERLSKMQNIQCRHDGDTRSHMHHKFAIVDGAVLITGSFNWTRAAVITNRENVVIIQNAPQAVEMFRTEFNSLWAAFATNTKMPAPGTGGPWKGKG